MTLAELAVLITSLITHGANPNATVRSGDPDTNQMEDVTGIVYGDTVADLQTDDLN